MTWAEAIDRYGTDKPDLRFGMELVELTEVFAATGAKVLAAPAVKALRLEGGGSLSRARLDALVDQAKAWGTEGPGLVPGGGEGPGSGARLAARPPPLRRQSGPACWPPPGRAAGDLLLVVADEHRTACTVLGQLRLAVGGRPVGEGPHRYVWVVEFPMFDGVDAAGNPVPAHHPFTMPHPDDLDLLASDPAAVRSQAYDLVLNGWELGSGSVRIHRADIQSPGVRCPGHLGRGGGVPVRVPARGLPLRGAAPRRLRLRDGPAGGAPLPARRTSARSSPSPRPSRGPTP